MANLWTLESVYQRSLLIQIAALIQGRLTESDTVLLRLSRARNKKFVKALAFFESAVKDLILFNLI